MTPVAWLDDVGKPAWIALAIVGFFLWWPLGLVVLGISDRERTDVRMLEFAARRRVAVAPQEQAQGWCGPRAQGGMRHGMRSSGNRAFDEYRDETLRRLEEEEREFKEFLDRLRQAKDKAEFDQFMAEMRSRRPADGGPAPQPQG